MGFFDTVKDIAKNVLSSVLGDQVDDRDIQQLRKEDPEFDKAYRNMKKSTEKMKNIAQKNQDDREFEF